MPSDNIEIHGNQALVVKDPGKLITDNTGLMSCTAIFSIPGDMWKELPDIKSRHPIFDSVEMERREVALAGNFAIATCEYAGTNAGGGDVSGFNVATYELLVGVSEEPIETHPEFVRFAGTPTAPLNGAWFEKVGGADAGKRADAASPAPSDDGYIFGGFAIIAKGGKNSNPFAKIEHYLEASCMTWRKIWTSKVAASSVASVGFIDTPEGPAPKLATGRNWLNMGITSVKRGSAYQSTAEWRASGRRGWIKEIYSK